MLFVGSDSHGPSQSQFPVPKLIPWKMPFSGLPEDPEGAGLSNVTVVVVVAVTPVPERGIVSEELEALLVKVKLPVTDPADFGANVTLKDVLWLADKVTGKVGPLRLNPVPVTAA